jgi:cytochrome c-type biogenesis protein CcmH/NrfG
MPRPVADPDAYALYQTKRLKQFGSRRNESANDALIEAVKIDPRFVDAWTVLASVYLNQAGLGLRPFAEGYELAEQAIERAQGLDARDPNALCLLGDLK